MFRFLERTNVIRIYEYKISIVCQYMNLWSSLCLWWTYHFCAFVYIEKKIYSLVIWGIANGLVQLAITNIEILIWYSSRQHNYLKNKREKKKIKRRKFLEFFQEEMKYGSNLIWETRIYKIMGVEVTLYISIFFKVIVYFPWSYISISLHCAEGWIKTWKMSRIVGLISWDYEEI